jgi:hypothetical protein
MAFTRANWSQAYFNSISRPWLQAALGKTSPRPNSKTDQKKDPKKDNKAQSKPLTKINPNKAKKNP